MSERSGPDHLSGQEIGKDAVQSVVQAAAATAGELAGIVSKAVQDVAGALGGLATELYEIREAAQRAAQEQQD
ncbi:MULTISPECIES: hypothetical protein [unclassified Nocardioides]|uniref:hypothetical protein n=1 Tax=unclassified Nocardioides TaxID=2615069 RepID=UPI001E38F96F|nr:MULTISPECIES: hypothetical protein [unclassified Nocardioides]MCD4526174.1 hypothetical protein [Nocardioides sp. cx-173]MCD4534386.1 hypothetical protein [Nocardioides sp. cx-169]UGB40611.1 hypothetical protein LQ940_14655 [Nocardioides sp. cx-173]